MDTVEGYLLAEAIAVRSSNVSDRFVGAAKKYAGRRATVGLLEIR